MALRRAIVCKLEALRMVKRGDWSMRDANVILAVTLSVEKSARHVICMVAGKGSSAVSPTEIVL